MKKSLMWMFATILFCGAMTTALSSCSSDDENNEPQPTIIYTYWETHSLLVTIEDLSEIDLPQVIGADYKKAIASVASDGKERDTEVIAACDKVYQTHKTQYANKLKGTVTITKNLNVNGEDKESNVLIEYNYD